MLYVLGMGYSHPTTIIDNKFIESLDIGTNEAWILEKIGIVERVTTLPLDYIKTTRNQDPREAIKVATHTPTDLGVIACEMAIKNAGISVSDIGLVVCDSCTPMQTTPSEAQRIAKRLGLGVPAYDVFTACPAFALHMDLLSNFKEEKVPEYALCISTGTVTQKVNYNDRSDAAIWGDGAAAWVVSTRNKGKLKVIDTYFMADPLRCDAVVVDTFGHFHQDGRAVRNFSVLQTVKLLRGLEERFALNWEVDAFIGHQANSTMLEQIRNNRGIPDHSHWHNVKHIGNQAGAGAPASLAMNWDKIKPGQKIVIAVVGAGLSWGSVLLEGT